MRLKTAAMVLLTMCAAAGCKKKGSGGGGGGWLVGESGLMANVGIDGNLGAGYDLGSSEELFGISCEGVDTAYVVGAHGTLLRTVDAGHSWASIDVGTTTTLRSVAAWNDTRHVYAVGDGAFLVSNDGGDSFRSVKGEHSANWTAVTSDWRGQTSLALSDDGKVWRFDGTSVAPRQTLAGARTIAVSHDGAAAVAVGDTVWRSLDGGFTWNQLDVGPVELRDAWVESDGRVTAVGDAGSVLTIAADGSPTLAFPGEKNLRTVYISAEGFGVAAGDDGETLLTYDSGESWESGPNVGHTVYAVDQIGLNSLE